jgi:hypothetical protein
MHEERTGGGEGLENPQKMYQQNLLFREPRKATSKYLKIMEFFIYLGRSVVSPVIKSIKI